MADLGRWLTPRPPRTQCCATGRWPVLPACGKLPRSLGSILPNLRHTHFLRYTLLLSIRTVRGLGVLTALIVRIVNVTPAQMACSRGGHCSIVNLTHRSLQYRLILNYGYDYSIAFARVFPSTIDSSHVSYLKGRIPSPNASNCHLKAVLIRVSTNPLVGIQNKSLGILTKIVDEMVGVPPSDDLRCQLL